MSTRNILTFAAAVAVSVLLCGGVHAQDDTEVRSPPDASVREESEEFSSEEEIAKKLSNPAASLISVPFVFSHEGNIGPLDDGTRASLKIQPVIHLPASGVQRPCD